MVHKTKPKKKSQALSQDFPSLTQNLFTQISNRSFPILVRVFYLNLRLVGTSLKTFLRGMEIYLHKDNFRRILGLPTIETSFTLIILLGLRNFNHSKTINTIVINPMEIRKSLSSPSTWNQRLGSFTIYWLESYF